MEIKKPTKKELYDYLLSKYIEDKCKEEADEINKKSMSRVKKHKERLMEITQKSSSVSCLRRGSPVSALHVDRRDYLFQKVWIFAGIKIRNQKILTIYPWRSRVS
ncbi:TPA: hypothetical protein MRP33_001231 [Escherichia coli]|nr:hypothetical protein [Escherichia coli]EHW3105684.1 hypothetical protein [Escherichia coli]EHW9753984.1 hypothetical protein [Escherichia coli]HAH3139011.1 hypothetical protein [Escherichia coli]HAL9527101.1 hypothetical protein [Escherichia coli]